MSNISPNSLFHFTPKLEYLINIFQNGFQPRYYLEELKLNDHKAIRGHNFGIPMTCFCDIPLGQITNHINTYGSYGIGMKKEWAIENRLNPIIYLNKDSFIAEPLSNLGENGINLLKIDDENIKKIGSQIMNSWVTLQMYSKPYIGSFVRQGKKFDNVKFYNEREWRYIPTKENKPAPFGTLSVEKMQNKIILGQENKKLEEFQLNFTPDDVKYIFVKEEKEIHKMVNELRKIKSPHYNSVTIDILTSKILTTRNISEDF